MVHAYIFRLMLLSGMASSYLSVFHSRRSGPFILGFISHRSQLFVVRFSFNPHDNVIQYHFFFPFFE